MHRIGKIMIHLLSNLRMLTDGEGSEDFIVLRVVDLLSMQLFGLPFVISLVPLLLCLRLAANMIHACFSRPSNYDIFPWSGS